MIEGEMIVLNVVPSSAYIHNQHEFVFLKLLRNMADAVTDALEVILISRRATFKKSCHVIES
jgi:hypothetical protein